MLLKFNFKAIDLINENVAKKEDVDIVAKWLEQEGLPRFVDEQIILFLLSCDNNVKETMKKMKLYVKITHGAPEMFVNWNIKRIDLQKLLNVVEIFLLPKRTDDNCIVIFSRLVDCNYRNFELNSFFTILLMTIEAATYESPASGWILVHDFGGTSLKHLSCMRVGLLKVFLQYVLQAQPLQMKKIHFINAFPLLHNFLALIKIFYKTIAAEKVVVHNIGNDISQFYDNYISQKFFPIDYGGDMPCCQTLHRNQIEKFKQMADYFASEQEQRRRKTSCLYLS